VGQVSPIDLDFMGDFGATARRFHIEPPLHPADLLREGRVHDPGERLGCVKGDYDGVGGQVHTRAIGHHDSFFGHDVCAQADLAGWLLGNLVQFIAAGEFGMFRRVAYDVENRLGRGIDGNF